MCKAYAVYCMMHTVPCEVPRIIHHTSYRVHHALAARHETRDATQFPCGLHAVFSIHDMPYTTCYLLNTLHVARHGVTSYATLLRYSWAMSHAVSGCRKMRRMLVLAMG